MASGFIPTYPPILYIVVLYIYPFTFLIVLGTTGSYISYIYGGWTSAMTTLAVFMAIDYITDLIVAGVFKASPKSFNGALESSA